MPWKSADVGYFVAMAESSIASSTKVSMKPKKSNTQKLKLKALASVQNVTSLKNDTKSATKSKASSKCSKGSHRTTLSDATGLADEKEILKSKLSGEERSRRPAKSENMEKNRSQTSQLTVKTKKKNSESHSMKSDIANDRNESQTCHQTGKSTANMKVHRKSGNESETSQLTVVTKIPQTRSGSHSSQTREKTLHDKSISQVSQQSQNASTDQKRSDSHTLKGKDTGVVNNRNNSKTSNLTIVTRTTLQSDSKTSQMKRVRSSERSDSQVSQRRGDFQIIGEGQYSQNSTTQKSQSLKVVDKNQKSVSKVHKPSGITSPTEKKVVTTGLISSRTKTANEQTFKNMLPTHGTKKSKADATAAANKKSET